MHNVDVAVIGAGVAGASVAYRLAETADVALLEREDAPGYHSTGRSAAQFVRAYGAPQVRALTLASEVFFHTPPDGFSDGPLLTERTIITIATEAEGQALDAHRRSSEALGARFEALSPDDACRQAPILRREGVAAALIESSYDIDVNRVHQGFLRGLTARGGVVASRAEVSALSRDEAVWKVETRRGETFLAPIVVNAAGAWADGVAALAGIEPLGLQPLRRTALRARAPEGMDVSAWPMVRPISDELYFKPDAGALLISPADETPSPPTDAQPEDWDVAVAIDRMERVTTLTVGRPLATWAGLRTFAPDGGLVIGQAADAPGFFWLAGQGGYGIQTAPAASAAAAGLIADGALPDALAAFGLTEEALGADRLRSP